MKSECNTMARLLLMLITLLFIPGTTWCGEQSLLNKIEEERATIFEKNRPSVVRIHTIYSDPGSGEGIQLGRGFMHGTGFVFDKKGYILTVDKAVSGAEEIWVTLASGMQLPAELVATDPNSEVAVIRVDAGDLQAVEIGNSDRVRVGHFAFILGNTFGNLTPSFGSAHEIDREQDLMHITAPVHPSYGGAPVFCSTGEVVGMVWAAPNPWTGLDQASGSMMAWQEIPTTVFVVPINRAIRIARNLLSGVQAYGWLGVEGQYDADRGGFQVQIVMNEGPAALSGITHGDLILCFQGEEILSGEHLRSLVLSTSPGTQVHMKIKRDERPETPSVEVGRMPPDVLADNHISGGSHQVSSTVRPGVTGELMVQREIHMLRQEVRRLQQQLLVQPKRASQGN
jgi:serine protease Do